MPEKENQPLLTKEHFDLKGRDYMYRALIENMSEGALVLNKLHTVVYSNKHFAALTGFDLQRIIGSNFQTLLREEDAAAFSKSISDALNHQAYCQLQLLTKNKGTVPAIASVSSFIVEGKTYFCIIISDISLQKKIEEGLENQVAANSLEIAAANRRLNEINNELRSANQVLDNFVHAVAHDLRTPVANLKMIGEMSEKAPDEHKVKLFQKVRENIDILDNILKGLVQIIETQDQKEINRPEIDIIKIVEEVLFNMSARIKARNATITIHKETGEKINHVEGYIRSIVRNMVSNALKYSMPGQPPKLKITLKKEKEYFVLAFSDKGIGIDLEKHADNMFKPFQRFSSNEKGMGIGLHISNTMVCKNGGFIKVKSAPGKGTTFRVYLKEYKS
ncbi:MAG: sensor histidine kinase [Tangfeifania sp.]